MMFELSPEIEIWWCGMRGSSRSMQLSGWEFAVQQGDWVGMHTWVIAKHRQSGTVLRGRLRTDELIRSHHERSLAPVMMDEVSFLGHEKQLVVYGEMPSFGRVDMIPSLTEKPARNPFDVFSPWAPDAEEIIVDQPTVASLMEQIRSLQEPELAEVRKRNRLREYRAGNDREVVRAQILTLAA